MNDIEKMIYALKTCADVQGGFTDQVYVFPVCLYGREDGTPCESLHKLLNDAAEMLKAQDQENAIPI